MCQPQATVLASQAAAAELQALRPPQSPPRWLYGHLRRGTGETTLKSGGLAHLSGPRARLCVSHTGLAHLPAAVGDKAWLCASHTTMSKNRLGLGTQLADFSPNRVMWVSGLMVRQGHVRGAPGWSPV